MTRMPIFFLALAAIGSGGAAIATGSTASGRAHAGNHEPLLSERAVPPRT